MRMPLYQTTSRLLTGLCIALGASLAANGASAQGEARIPRVKSSTLVESLKAGHPQNAIVILHPDAPFANGLLPLQVPAGLAGRSKLLNERKTRFDRTKSQLLSKLTAQGLTTSRSFSHLPALTVSLRNEEDLRRLQSLPEVKAVYANKAYSLNLSQSLNQIAFPTAISTDGGRGTTVAIIDTGTDYRHQAFSFSGNPAGCTAIGTPDCRVSHLVEFGDQDFSPDDNMHGTLVSGIAAGVAARAKLMVFDVFSRVANPSGGFSHVAYTEHILYAVNAVIEQATTLNIVSMNLSLGDEGEYGRGCVSALTDAFAMARVAGVVPVVAAGNQGHQAGLNMPACDINAVSVGSVEDGTPATQAKCGGNLQLDRVSCFSNSAPYLTLLAPGEMISAAGQTMRGTSMAAPHVAGSIALLKGSTGGFPGDSVDQTLLRLTSGGVPVQDGRNGRTLPRLDITRSLQEMASVALAANPPVGFIGRSTTLKATVIGRAPTGTVRFLAGNQLLGTAPLVDGVALHTFTVQKAGRMSVTAQYVGDNLNRAAMSPAVNVDGTFPTFIFDLLLD